jgi:hypothetical protein
MSYITQTDLSAGPQLGSQMIQLATLHAISKTTGHDLVIFNECLNLGRGIKLFDAFNLDSIKLLSFKALSPELRDFSIEDTLMDGRVFNLTPKHNFNMRGHFHSYHYFHNFKTDILGLFNFKAPIYQEALNQINNIKNNQSTPLASIHFRRTDYLEVSSLNLSTDYYAKALTTLSENIGAFKLLVFSDDIEWCKNNIEHDDNVFFIENNTNYVDMCMMTLCDHNIIANSTFSWWGAYLNKNPDSLTICPMNYIGDENHFLNKNYYPHNWISLKEK